VLGDVMLQLERVEHLVEALTHHRRPTHVHLPQVFLHQELPFHIVKVPALLRFIAEADIEDKIGFFLLLTVLVELLQELQSDAIFSVLEGDEEDHGEGRGELEVHLVEGATVEAKEVADEVDEGEDPSPC